MEIAPVKKNTFHGQTPSTDGWNGKSFLFTSRMENGFHEKKEIPFSGGASRPTSINNRGIKFMLCSLVSPFAYCSCGFCCCRSVRFDGKERHHMRWIMEIFIDGAQWNGKETSLLASASGFFFFCLSSPSKFGEGCQVMEFYCYCKVFFNICHLVELQMKEAIQVASIDSYMSYLAHRPQTSLSSVADVIDGTARIPTCKASVHSKNFKLQFSSVCIASKGI